MTSGYQIPREYTRDPVTGVIRGAEAFDLGQGSHAVLLLHGWHSSPREMRPLAEKLSALGFRCHCPLLKGHGTRLEDLLPTRFEDYLADATSAWNELSAAHERVSICGLSMGGLMALYLAARVQVANLILIAPFLQPYGKTFGLPNRWLVGRVPLPAVMRKKNPGPIRDPVAAADHVAYSALATQSMISVAEAGRRFWPLAHSVQSPILIHHSQTDTTSDYSGTVRLMKSIGSSDKTLLTYQRGNHVITLDFDRPELENQTETWILRHR